MGLFEDFFLFLEDHLPPLSVSILKKIFFDLYPHFMETHREQIEEIYDFFRRKLADIAELVGSQKVSLDVFNVDNLLFLARFPHFTVDEIKIGKLILDSTNLNSFKGSRILKAYGLISSLDQNITLDYPFYIKDKSGTLHRVPSTLSEALCNLAALFRDERFREEWVSYVAARNSEPFDPSLVTHRIEPSEAAEGLNLIYQVVNAIAEDIGRLKDSKAFYNNLGRFFSKESKAVHIFSATSGLVVPREYFGDDQADSSRLAYFETLRNAQVPIYYQLDPFMTIKALSREDEERAVEIFAKFLIMPNIEITSARFGEGSWKECFTLSSAGCGVAFGMRGKEEKKIQRGVYANVWKESNKHPFTLIHKLYEEEKREGVCEVIKEMGEELNLQQARERARESIRRWKLLK